jgi:hypothetical protein
MLAIIEAIPQIDGDGKRSTWLRDDDCPDM